MTSAKAPPLISVIIPSYNRSALVCEAVESALNQTWNNIEVIVVDDGSTDDTKEQVEKMLEGHWKHKVRLLMQAHKGASAARNTGLAASRGDYIQFLDSDDLLFKDKIITQIAILESPDAAGAECCSCYGLIGPSLVTAKRICKRYYSPREFLLAMISREVHVMQTSAPLWRKNFLLKSEGWCEKLVCGNDLEYYVRLVSCCSSITFANAELFWVRVHPIERLSIINGNENKIRASVIARELVYFTICRAGLWDRPFQISFLSTLRTIYFNLLSLNLKHDICKFEKFYLRIAMHPSFSFHIVIMILMRKLFGRNVILIPYRLEKVVKRKLMP